MADFHTFYGNWVSGFYRTRIEAEWTNVTESGFTLTVRTYVEIAEYYHDDGSNFSGRANPGNGYGSWVAGASGYLYGPTSLLLTSKSTYITRTHAQQYISVYGETTNTFNPAYAGPSNASGSVGCSPKSSYAVTFNANGGNGAPAAQTKWYGETLTISATKPTRSGYIFKGWATSASATTATYQPGASYTTNAPLALYAVWQQGTYTIAYAANGGSSTPASQTKTHGVALTLRPAISRANGTTNYTVSYSINYSGGTNPSSGTATKTTKYTFAGWKATNGTVYAGGASYTTDAATTMTAQWTSSSSTTSVTLPTPTRTGYTFQGWWTASTGGTKVGNGGATYTPTASTTLHAHWSIIVYAVSYSANGGSGAPASQSKNHGTSITLSSTQPTRSGYTFLGWSTNKTGTGTAYAPGGTYSTNASATLYAVWVGVQVTSLTAYRSNSAGTRSDAGTYGHLSAGWKALGTIAGTLTVTATANGSSVTLAGGSGSKTATADLTGTATSTFGGSYAESTAVNVVATATLSVTYGGSTRTVTAQRIATIPKVFRLLDALAGGTGLAIGTVATLANTLEIGIQTVARNSIRIFDSRFLIGAALQESVYSLAMGHADRNGENIGYSQARQLTDGTIGYAITAINKKSDNSTVTNSIVALVGTDGTRSYQVGDPAAFRTAINAQTAGSYVTYPSGANSVINTPGGTTQAFSLYSTVVNTANTTLNGKRLGLFMNNANIALYNSTDSEWLWTAYTTKNKPTYADLGTVPIANGGTGATTVANARKALFGTNLNASAQYLIAITDNWESGGYIQFANASATGTANTQLNALTWRYFKFGTMLFAFAHGTTKTLAVSTAVGSMYYQSGGITVPIPSSIGFTAAPYGVLCQMDNLISCGPSGKSSWTKTQVKVDAWSATSRASSGYEINLVVWGV